MKKFILSSLLFLLIGSYGGAIVATASAQTVTPTEAATLGRSLAAMKAKLLDLQAQATAESGTALGGASPSAQNVAEVSAVLRALTVSLGQLTQTIATNPSVLTENNRVVLRSALSGVSASLLAVNMTLVANNAPVAVSSPAKNVPLARSSGAALLDQPTVAAAQPASTNAPVIAAVVANDQPQVQPQSVLAANRNTALGTAQVAGQVQFSRGWMIALGVILILFAVILVWKFRPGRKGNRVLAYQATAPISSVPKSPLPMPTAQKSVDADTISPYGASRSTAPTASVTPPSANNS